MEGKRNKECGEGECQSLRLLRLDSYCCTVVEKRSAFVNPKQSKARRRRKKKQRSKGRVRESINHESFRLFPRERSNRTLLVVRKEKRLPGRCESESCGGLKQGSALFHSKHANTVSTHAHTHTHTLYHYIQPSVVKWWLELLGRLWGLRPRVPVRWHHPHRWVCVSCVMLRLPAAGCSIFVWFFIPILVYFQEKVLQAILKKTSLW